ncbi:hypothetical protein [Phaeobacter sp. HF9A]|uniref:hypothetical protein n=1 Tax=Phaeobacter sp. HF9A TaxID=2721561 RepID=UPI00142F9C6C|nr:hypothetical protein [Phaeobacter sp. HF9A]NIZ12770.1 hypothetical protein [Phaeobacter sp. HF9A]
MTAEPLRNGEMTATPAAPGPGFQDEMPHYRRNIMKNLIQLLADYWAEDPIKPLLHARPLPQS